MSWSNIVRQVLVIARDEGHVNVRLVQARLGCDSRTAWGYLLRMMREGWLIGWEGTRLGETVEEGVPLGGGPTPPHKKVMDLLVAVPAATTKELSIYTGLSREAVVKLLKDMVDRGEVKKSTTKPPGSGRPSTIYSIVSPENSK